MADGSLRLDLQGPAGIGSSSCGYKRWLGTRKVDCKLLWIQSNCDDLLKQQPTPLEAQYVRAFALSRNPSALGGPTKAIDALTALQAQQEKAEHVDPYLLLADSYRLPPTPDANAKAIKVIRAGLGFFPDSSELRGPPSERRTGSPRSGSPEALDLGLPGIGSCFR
jgi:hypothetical protein